MRSHFGLIIFQATPSFIKFKILVNLISSFLVCLQVFNYTLNIRLSVNNPAVHVCFIRKLDANISSAMLFKRFHHKANVLSKDMGKIQQCLSKLTT